MSIVCMAAPAPPASVAAGGSGGGRMVRTQLGPGFAASAAVAAAAKPGPKMPSSMSTPGPGYSPQAGYRTVVVPPAGGVRTPKSTPTSAYRNVSPAPCYRSNPTPEAQLDKLELTPSKQPMHGPATTSRAKLYPPSDDLRLTIYPGDVLFVHGNGAVSRIGQAGGLFGHVMVVLGAPRKIDWGSDESRELNAAWPGGVSYVWKIATIESSRDTTGLHRAEMILRVDPGSRELLLIGDWVAGAQHNELGVIEDEVVELWQSPPEMRSQIFLELMAEVLSDMTDAYKSWSLTTAGMAMLRSAALDEKGKDRHQFLAEVRACWETAPICTSVVITFWQRYFLKLAWRTGQSEVHLIMTLMPLKADRGLPGELLVTMRACGWMSVSRFPAAEAPGPSSAAVTQQAVALTPPLLPQLAGMPQRNSVGAKGQQSPLAPFVVMPGQGRSAASPVVTARRLASVSPPPPSAFARPATARHTSPVTVADCDKRPADGEPRRLTTSQPQPQRPTMVGAPLPGYVPGCCSVVVRPRHS